MRFLLTAEEFGAAEALRIGLVQEVVAHGKHVERARADRSTSSGRHARRARRSRGHRRSVRAQLAADSTHRPEGAGRAAIQLLLTRRLLLAKQLLTETGLPITEIAFASGFSSLRRFNDAFNTRYGMAPTRLRRTATEDVAAISATQTSTLQLAYRPPYDWDEVLAFLAARALKGVEDVTGGSYARTVQLGKAQGWIRVSRLSKTHALAVEFTHSLTPVLPALLSRVRALFDLDARPDLIARHLSRDARLKSAVRAHPGRRVPGAFNGFEMGLRAILGQQVTVKAATTIASRFVEAFGEPIVTPLAELNRLSPSPVLVARSAVNDIARHGIVAARCRSIIALARAQASGLCLDSSAHHDPDDSIKRLAELPGIGPWTAHYIAMRALRWPDAFPKEDIALRKNLGGVTPKKQKPCHNHGGRGAATRSCTSGAWRGHLFNPSTAIPAPAAASAASRRDRSGRRSARRRTGTCSPCRRAPWP